MKKFVKFEDFTQRKLWNLRKEINLGSLFIGDYENSYYLSPKSMASFFDGYVDFMFELAREDNPRKHCIDFNFVCKHYDNSKVLYQWFQCSDDFSWVQYEKP